MNLYRAPSDSRVAEPKGIIPIPSSSQPGPIDVEQFKWMQLINFIYKVVLNECFSTEEISEVHFVKQVPFDVLRTPTIFS